MEKIAFTSTNDPVLPPTASTAGYLFSNMTRTIYTNASPDSPETLDGLIEMELTISPDISKLNIVEWDTGTLVRSPTRFDEGDKKVYELRLKYSPTSSTLHDELLTTSNLKDIVFKWTRSTNDYIEITCADCSIIRHPLISPPRDISLVDTVVIKPRAVTIEVKDSIAGGYYGD